MTKNMTLQKRTRSLQIKTKLIFTNFHPIYPTTAAYQEELSSYNQPEPPLVQLEAIPSSYCCLLEEADLHHNHLPGR